MEIEQFPTIHSDNDELFEKIKQPITITATIKKMDKKILKQSNTEKLSLDIAKRVGKHNIPAIFLAGDRDNNHSCVVMDSRKEMREINISILLDAMMNGDPSGELINIVCTAAAILLAHSKPMEKGFLEYLEKQKAEQKDIHITPNVADA